MELTQPMEVYMPEPIKPKLTEMIMCTCGSGHTVSLILLTGNFPDYVCWCECGRVTVRRDNEVTRIFNFKH